MKHKEEGYCLFPNDHVWMVGFPPGFATDIHCLSCGIVKPSFKTTGSYSTAVALSKISGYVLGAQCNSKAGAGGCCEHVAACLGFLSSGYLLMKYSGILWLILLLLCLNLQIFGDFFPTDIFMITDIN